MDMMSEEADPKMQGLEKFETIMLSLGLSERKPIPEPISFPEPDPLGASLVASNTRNDDVTSSIGWNTDLVLNDVVDLCLPNYSLAMAYNFSSILVEINFYEK